MTTERTCRVCGCTQNNACLTPDGPCYWVAPDLCSGCAPRRRDIWADFQPTSPDATITLYGDVVFPRRRRRPAFLADVSFSISPEMTETLRRYATDHGEFLIPSRPADSGAKSDDPTLQPPKVG